MEGLNKRAYFFAIVLLAAGAVNYASLVRTERPNKDEKWMEARAPEKVANMAFVRSTDNPAQSYRMNELTYRVLAPFGIVARLYTDNAGRGYDVVLIASESRASFHDPRICFSGQGWTLVEQRTIEVPTRSRGVVPITLTKMDGPERGQLAAFFYRGPTGFHDGTIKVKLDMFWARFRGREDVEGVFYRFIPTTRSGNEQTDIENLKAFIADYLEASKASSDGYF